MFQVMLGGGWLDKMLKESGALPEEADVAAMAKDAACRQLGISANLQPSKVNVVFQKVSLRSVFTVSLSSGREHTETSDWVITKVISSEKMEQA